MSVSNHVLTCAPDSAQSSNSALASVNADLEQRVRERTAELEVAMAAARQADNAKSQFLAKMSHEIRTPMNGILGMLEALRGTSLDTTQADYVNTACHSAECLLTLIDQLLDFAKIEAGKLSIESITFDLHHLIEQSVQLWKASAAGKHLQLIHDIDPRTPRWLRGDPGRLRQVLTNLISNALKFTTEGGVTVAVDTMGIDLPADSAETTLMLRFTVQDTGIGMTPETQSQLFQMFSQADGAATSRIYGGTGLGLAICKQLTTLMGGEINVDSTPDQGTCFTLVLPLLRCAAPTNSDATEPAMAMPGNNQHILVVDDNDINCKVAAAILERLGCRVSIAVDGLAAVTAVQRGRFDLVFMDCHMPILDGVDATKSIRAWENANQRPALPIVAVSASAFQEDRDRCAAAGMNDFIAKPVRLSALRDALKKWLGDTMALAELPTADEFDDLAELPGELFAVAQFAQMRVLAGAKFSELLRRFADDAERQVANMENALRRQDAEPLRRAAHKLKGSSSSIGACALADLCAAVELKARALQLAEIHGDLQLVEACFSRTAACLTAFR